MSAAHTQGLMTVVPAEAHEIDVDVGVDAFMALTLNLNIGEKNFIGQIQMSSCAAQWNGVDNEAECRANAARMVACWNACEGVESKLLKEHPAPFTALRTERDALRTALESIAFTSMDPPMVGTMSCALCGSDHHNRSACPWGKVHRAAQTVILVALLCAAPIYGALMDADRDLAEAKEVAEAQHSRDWAGAHVCGAAAHALWVDDKTLQCVSVVAGGKP